MKEGTKVGEGVYLGDGAYVHRLTEFDIEIFTSHKVGKHDLIVLNVLATEVLVKWLREVFGEIY